MFFNRNVYTIYSNLNLLCVFYVKKKNVTQSCFLIAAMILKIYICKKSF